MHSNAFESGTPTVTAARTIEGWTQWGGILQLDDPAQAAAELGRARTGPRPLVLGLDQAALSDVLTTLIDSPNVRLVEYKLRYLVPEAVVAVVAHGGLVVRQWVGSEPGIDLIGPDDRIADC